MEKIIEKLVVSNITEDYFKLKYPIYESVIDFPQFDLCRDVWAKRGDGIYVLREDVERAIMEYIEKCPHISEADIDAIHIVGSICSNLYLDDTDIDIHLIPDEDFPKEKDDEVKKWSQENPMFIVKHPLELYVQRNENQDFLSDGCYDVLDDSWCVGPDIYDSNYNPYEVMASVIRDVQRYARAMDIDLGELGRDIYDYNKIISAISRLSGEQKVKLLKFVEKKIREIEDDIRKLLKDKKQIVDLRHHASQPKTRKQALSSKSKWQKVNATFKFLQRYGYLDLITKLERMLEDNKLSGAELAQISKLVPGASGLFAFNKGGKE